MRRVEEVLAQITPKEVVTEEARKEVAELAFIIWHEHYDPIIGKAQVEYMVESFQSEAAIRRQTEQEGYEYYLLRCQGETCGYVSLRKEEEAMFLSKFYILKQFRGRGFARRAIEWMEQLCCKHHLSRIWLTVNRGNENSIHIYESLGFRKAGTKVADIGGGFVMDDYVMEKMIV